MADIKQQEQETLLDEVQSHLEDSDSYLETLREDWDDLEAMLIVKLTDSLSSSTPNRIFDPRLSTIVYERVSRVMAQNPKGKAYAQSKDDIGKSLLMNLLLKYFYKNANEQDSMLVKLRLWDLYSLVYGSMFALVPWRVNPVSGYVGPELNILPIRDCFPQPTKRNVEDMDWFVVRNVVSIDWLKEQDKSMWMNVDDLEASIKNAKSGGDGQRQDDDKRSYVEREYYPGTYGDLVYPQIELYTEYRRDKWVSWTPQRIDEDTSRPFILRVAEESYPSGMLPIVAKHAFPLIDSPIGLGEFARGKTLQLAINSLWNLYMEGVKYSVFPPLHINMDNVVASSIKWGAGEYWYMSQPNSDVQPMNMNNSQVLATFNSTFGALVSTLESQAGTTSVRESESVESGLGKTPEAIKYISERESARDEWDRVMMEQAIEKVYDRWINLSVNKLEKRVQMRLFKEEIEDIQRVHPDVVEMFKSKERGSVKVGKGDLDSAYDFVLETGSTAKPNLEAEQANLTTVLKAVLENPAILQSLEEENKTVNVSELFKRWLVAGGTKDFDKIIVDKKPLDSEVEGLPDQQDLSGQEVPQAPVSSEGSSVNPDEFVDPDIRQAVMSMFGGTQSVPSQPYGQ